MKLFTLILPLLTAVALVPTVVSRPLNTDSETDPALLGKLRSVGQASHVSPKPVELDTNAKRFARGLPPLPPSKSRRNKGSPVRRTGASPLPPVTCTSCSGVIRVYNRDTGSPLGYVSKIGSGGATAQTYQYQTDQDINTLRVHFTLPSGTTGTVSNLDIVTDNSILPNANAAKYLGFTMWDDYTVKDGTGPGFVFMAGTSQTPAGSPPQSGANTWVGSAAKVESAVWTVDVSTWSLKPTWVNPDNSISGGWLFSENEQILYGYPVYRASTDPNWTPVRYNLSFKFVPDVILPQRRDLFPGHY